MSSVTDFKKKKCQKSKKFTCLICDYTTSYKNHYEKHLKTKKHLSRLSLHDTFFAENSPSKKQIKEKLDDEKQNLYFCKNCKTHYSSKKILKDHMKQCKKHIISSHVCRYCKKVYKSRNGRWLHEKKCLKNVDLIKKVLKENEELKRVNYENEMKIIKAKENLLLKEKENLQLEKENLNKEKSTTIINNNYIQNNTIQIFLDEHCKNAMSLEYFINQINVSLKDIQETKHLGYVDGMSNIFLKSLKNIPDTERPIHSTDKKRTKFIIKAIDGWEKDDGSIVDDAVSKVKFKHVNALSEWEKQNPGYEKDPNKLNEWQELLDNMNPGVTEKEREKKSKAIQLKIAEMTNIKDAIVDLNVKV